MKIIILLTALLLVIENSLSEITDINKKFTLLCEEKKSTGFVWYENNWEQLNFDANNKYIIKRNNRPISINSPDYDIFNTSPNNACSHGQKEKFQFSNSIHKYECYSINELGQEANFRTCFESWNMDKDLKPYLDYIECKSVGGFNWIMGPNKQFHRSAMSRILDDNPKDFDVKPPMSITVGICTEI